MLCNTCNNSTGVCYCYPNFNNEVTERSYLNKVAQLGFHGQSVLPWGSEPAAALLPILQAFKQFFYFSSLAHSTLANRNKIGIKYVRTKTSKYCLWTPIFLINPLNQEGFGRLRKLNFEVCLNVKFEAMETLFSLFSLCISPLIFYLIIDLHSMT